MKTKAGVLMGCKTPLPYLRESVDSILRQTYKDFEFLIIDDEGPADTWEYLQTLSDPRIKILRHEQCQGISKTLNEGLKLLKTEFVFNIDADDIAHPRRLEWQMKFLQKNPQIDVLGGAMRAISSEGKPTGKEYKVPLKSDEIAYQLLWSSAINHPTVAYRREVILAAGGYDAAWKTSMDYQLWTRLAREVQMANLARVLMDYRVHATQAHKTFDSHADEVRRSRLAYRAKLTGLPTKDCDETALQKDWPQRLKFYSLLAARFTVGKFRRDLARRLLREIKGNKEATRLSKALVYELHRPVALMAQMRGKL